MTTHLKSLIATAKTANKTIEYDHQTKVRRINALKKEDMNYCLQVDQPSTKSTQPSEMPGKKIMMIDIMMLEDKIQSITNKLQYVRNIEDLERKKWRMPELN